MFIYLNKTLDRIHREPYLTIINYSKYDVIICIPLILFNFPNEHTDEIPLAVYDVQYEYT